MNMKAHWDQVYTSKPPSTVSWFQAHAARSLRLIRDTGVALDAPILDVGGGVSVLVDDLLTSGFTNLSVLDLSATALQAARQRLDRRAAAVHWIEADITTVRLPAQAYAVWHDRAVFHFLTEPADRAAYVQQAHHAVTPGGYLIIATFADDGPTHCSDLPVMRYSAAGLQVAFGAAFTLVQQETEQHQTPTGSVQSFIYGVFRKLST